MIKNFIPKPLVLIILDGWGYVETTAYNAIAQAVKPNWDAFWQCYPRGLLQSSGSSVGLPDHQMGNSEVGHLTIGSGRVIAQDLVRIDQSITAGHLARHPMLLASLDQARNQRKAVHFLGLLSPGGVHSHERHLQELVQLSAQRGIDNIFVHAFLDGRDCPPKSAHASLVVLESLLQRIKGGHIASLVGRYYAMDRDQRWQRTRVAYDLLTQGKAEYRASTALSGLALAYARKETDEFVKPTVISPLGQSAICLNEGDSVFFVNYRADRARQLVQALIEEDFSHFNRPVWPRLGSCVSMTQYADNLSTAVLFPPPHIPNTLAAVLSEHGLTQLRLAETEKYAHITYFFNGGIEIPFPGEERILVPSKTVSSYVSVPEMKAVELTDLLIKAIRGQTHDVMICNFANPDMLGHTGDFPATVQAIEKIDTCLGKIVLALQEVGGEAIITADHGNAERLYDEIIQQPHTAHTCSPVPFIYIGRSADLTSHQGSLVDVAPTLLELLGLPKPKEMTGESLVCVH